jgi:two-component system CheB/CheR fusion protein
VHQIGKPGQYVRYLKENPHEIDVLFKELLIGVTNFFRNLDAWETLRPALEQLIFLNSDLQQKLLPIFHCALKPNGLLFRGPSENIGSFNQLFKPLDKPCKIFRRMENTRFNHLLPEIPAQPVTGDEGTMADGLISRTVRKTRVSKQIERLLLDRFAPTSVVVNHRVELSSAKHRCAATGEDITRDDVRVRANGEFVNIRQLRMVEEVGQAARAYFEGIVQTVREPLIVLGHDLRVISANRSFYRTFRTTAKQTEGELIHRLGIGQWDIPGLRKLFESILPKDSKFEDYEVEVELPKLGPRVFVLNARRLAQPAATGDMILLALGDMTN